MHITLLSATAVGFWPILFWLLMLLWLLGVLVGWPSVGTPANFRPLAHNLVLWLLLALLGAYAIGIPGVPGR